MLIYDYMVVQPLEVWLQSRVAGRKASQVDLRFGSEFLVLNHDLAQEFGTRAVHRILTVLSVHQAELFHSSPSCLNAL